LGFPQSVKEKMLIDAARHCCVCQRYKGVKIEVHHIVQEGLGGDNTYENAISLCFDCHADAGHYNPEHPRGTKFSPSELRRAKEKWIEMVLQHNIQQPTEPDRFYCRYYICKNYENLVEIANDDPSRFPVENPLLIKNGIIDYLTKVISKHSKSYRHASASGNSLTNKDDYLKMHRDAIVSSRKDDRFPYFEILRKPSKEELEALKREDGILQLMLAADLPIDQISIIGCCFEYGCELPHEEFIFRKLWCSFLAITNISDKPIALDSVVTKRAGNNNFSEFTTSSNALSTINLPKAPVPSNSTVILPIALLLPPLYPQNFESWHEVSEDPWEREQVQVVTHEGTSRANYPDYLVYGDQIIVDSIQYKIDGATFTQEVHKFDLSNMYTIDRHWQCGSCPHLFFKDNNIFYARELLAHCESKIGSDHFKVPENVDTLIIAEIEDEQTEITHIKINGTTLLENIYLKKSEYLEIPVKPGSTVEMVGKYVPDSGDKLNIPVGIKRNELVSHFINNMRLGLTNKFNRITTPSASLRAMQPVI
jgi:hypothetical protein